VFEKEMNHILTRKPKDEIVGFKPSSIQLKQAFNHEQTGGCWIESFASLKVNGVNAVVLGDDKGSLKLWDMNKHVLLYDYKEKKDRSKVCSILAYPKTSQIIVAFANQIRIFDILPNFALSPSKTLNHHKFDVYALESLENTDYIISGEWDNESKKLCMWRADSGIIKQEITLKYGCYCIKQLSGRDWVAVGHWKGYISIYELDKHHSLNESQFLIGHMDTVVDFAWDDRSRMLFSSSDDMTLRQWHLPQGNCVRVFDLKKEKAGSLLLYYESDYIVCTAFDGMMKVFKISTGELVHEIPITQGFKPMIMGNNKRKEIITRDKVHIKIWNFAC